MAVDLSHLPRAARSGGLGALARAKGGVYIAGGIAPRLIRPLLRSGFRRLARPRPHGHPGASQIRDPAEPAIADGPNVPDVAERFRPDLRGRRFGDALPAMGWSSPEDALAEQGGGGYENNLPRLGCGFESQSTSNGSGPGKRYAIPL